MSYKAFIEQFKGHILSYIIKDKGWTITKATNYLASKFNYDPYVYDVMCRIIENDHPKIILNRNPTITFGSILLMQVRGIKKDADDVTLNLLGYLN